MGSTVQQKKNARAAKRANGGKKMPQNVFLAVRKASSQAEAIEVYRQMTEETRQVDQVKADEKSG